jgi:hypothetical protein
VSTYISGAFQQVFLNLSCLSLNAAFVELHSRNFGTEDVEGWGGGVAQVAKGINRERPGSDNSGPHCRMTCRPRLVPRLPRVLNSTRPSVQQCCRSFLWPLSSGGGAEYLQCRLRVELGHPATEGHKYWHLAQQQQRTGVIPCSCSSEYFICESFRGFR